MKLKLVVFLRILVALLTKNPLKFLSAFLLVEKQRFFLRTTCEKRQNDNNLRSSNEN